MEATRLCYVGLPVHSDKARLLSFVRRPALASKCKRSRKWERVLTVSCTQAVTCGTKSLENGTWFKLICGASSQDAPSICTLSEIYTAVGADCIDVAADPAVIRAAQLGIDAGMRRKSGNEKPLLMISVNDDVDPHFRKAWFDTSRCPPDCSRPCEKVCPADAIDGTGVISDRCYGCGRCLPVCPYGFVTTNDFIHSPLYIRKLLNYGVDAIEIHTGPNRISRFYRIWKDISDVVRKLQVIAISFPQLGTDDEMKNQLIAMWKIIEDDIEQEFCRGIKLIWQTDGRPMSGDIGKGTARHSVSLAKKVRRMLSDEGIPGHVQLAGGTNDATVQLMKEAGILRDDERKELTASGIAVGGYARKIVKTATEDLGGEKYIYQTAMNKAKSLVFSIKNIKIMHQY